MNSRNVNRGIPITPAGHQPSIGAVAATSSRPVRRSYTASTTGDSLGGASTETDARAALLNMHGSRVAIYEEKMKEKRKKQLEEKMARYHFLIGNTLGKSDGLTMQEVRELQDKKNSEIAVLKLRETQECEKNPVEYQKEPEQEVGTDLAKSIREIRIQQQANYNATLQKKSSS